MENQTNNAPLIRIITLSNDVEEIPVLAAFVDETCECMGVDPSVSMQLNLAIEEAVVNSMTYAYPAGEKGSVEVQAQQRDNILEFVIRDNGIPFDPTSVKDADTTLSAEERPIGGLGIFLVRQLMDSISYQRIDNQNILTLRKVIQ